MSLTELFLLAFLLAPYLLFRKTMYKISTKKSFRDDRDLYFRDLQYTFQIVHPHSGKEDFQEEFCNWDQIFRETFETFHRSDYAFSKKFRLHSQSKILQVRHSAFQICIPDFHFSETFCIPNLHSRLSVKHSAFQIGDFSECIEGKGLQWNISSQVAKLYLGEILFWVGTLQTRMFREY